MLYYILKCQCKFTELILYKFYYVDLKFFSHEFEHMPDIYNKVLHSFFIFVFFKLSNKVKIKIESMSTKYINVKKLKNLVSLKID